MSDEHDDTVEDHVAALQGRDAPRHVAVDDATVDDHLGALHGDVELDPNDHDED